MPLTPQHLTDLITQLDLLNDFQHEEEKRLRVTLASLQQTSSLRFRPLRQRTLLALSCIEEDRAAVHDLRRRLTTGLNWASLLAEDFHDDVDVDYAVSPSSSEDTPLF